MCQRMFKNILLTGLPRSGKSTLLEKIVSQIPEKRGFLTREIRQEGERVGFEIVTDMGQKHMLASVDFRTPYKVSKYFVDVDGFDTLVSRFPKFTRDQVLYIDEIGQAELFSDKFRSMVLEYLDSPNLCIATISKVYSDSFTDGIKKRKDVVLFEITPENRDGMYRKLMGLVTDSSRNINT